MKRYSFKIRKPSKNFIQKAEYWLSLCCELYNAALEERQKAWKMNGKNIYYSDQQKELTELKRSGLRDDLKDVYTQVLRSPLLRAERAYQDFFRELKAGRRCGLPRFKSYKRYDSFTYTQNQNSAFVLNGDKLHLGKLGDCRLFLSRKIEGKIKTCTIKRQIDGWYAIFAVEENQSLYIPKTGKSIGLDLGLTSFATLSNGEKIENPRFLKSSSELIASSQRSISRKKKGSNNRNKATRIVAKQYNKISNQRKDFFFKTANQLVERYDQITVEDLQIQNMIKNRNLSNAIFDVCWGGFLTILSYKAESAGRDFLRISPMNTSQLCSGCNIKVPKDLKMKIHNCPNCGLILDRDENAAINIKNKGRTALLGMEKVTIPDEPRTLCLEGMPKRKPNDFIQTGII